MSELITTSSAYIINGDSPMTSVANTVAMTTFAVHTLQPLIFYRLWAQTQILESGRYISRVGRASRFLSLGRYRRYLRL